jgi:hypothetical protein
MMSFLKLRRETKNVLSLPMVMFATIFFKAVFFLTNPLSLLSPLCLSSSRSSWALPLASLSVYHSKKGRSGRTEQLGVGHCEYRSTSTCCLCSCCTYSGLSLKLVSRDLKSSKRRSGVKLKAQGGPMGQ